MLRLVPKAGLEPARYRYRWILSPLRLPIPSLRLTNRIIPQPASIVKNKIMEEKQLIESAQKGDKEAFSQLMMRYQNKIYAIAMRFCKNADDAWDVAQETVIKVYRALHRYGSKAAFSTWVYAIAKNAALDHLRKRSKAVNTEVGLEAVEYMAQLPAADPEQKLQNREAVRELLDIVNALPAGQRAVLVLRDIDGYSYEEIAQILAISQGTVKSRLARAREAVRKAYAQRQ